MISKRERAYEALEWMTQELLSKADEYLSDILDHGPDCPRRVSTEKMQDITGVGVLQLVTAVIERNG